MANPYFNNSNTSYTIDSFDYRENKKEADFPIAFGTDQNFLLGCGIAITSIIKNNPQTNISYHVFTNEISEAEKDRFLSLAEEHKILIVIYIITPDLSQLPVTNNWTRAIYYRFIIFDYFVGKYEQVLYLDSDIVCVGSLKEMITVHMNGAIAAVIPDAEEDWWIKKAQELKCDSIKAGYFNSGVLLVNLPVWDRENISREAINILKNKEMMSYISYPDQDVLNILFAGNLLFLDKKYNSQFNLNHELKKDIKIKLSENSVLIHYIGPTKPWHAWSSYSSTQPFMRIKAISPWKDEIQLEPKTSTQSRYAAKHYNNQGQHIASGKCWLKYYLYKLNIKHFF